MIPYVSIILHRNMVEETFFMSKIFKGFACQLTTLPKWNYQLTRYLAELFLREERIETIDTKERLVFGS